MDDLTRLKIYLQRALKGEKAPALAYFAIESDDSAGLEVLIDCGLNLQAHNFVFSAIDNSASKCLDLLLEKNANFTIGGRASRGEKLIYLEPLEYACTINNMAIAQKLIAHGAPLVTQSGSDILRKYRKYIGAENCEKLLKYRTRYLDSHNNTEKV